MDKALESTDKALADRDKALADTDTAVAVKAAPTRRSPGATSARVDRELARAEQVLAAAQRTPYKTALAGQGISAAFVATLAQDTVACRGDISAAVDHTAAKKQATQVEAAAKTALLRRVRGLQAAARQKLAVTNPAALAVYGIGEKLERLPRASLISRVEAILARLPGDILPGVDDGDMDALQEALASWTAAHQEQSVQQSGSTNRRGTRDAHLKSITERRRQIQFAADALYPYDDPEHQGTRGEFDLPLDRPYTG
ncbi:hypothetical protein [Armatimonas rosea]|uniref:Uncharacterized protein n=1 Tax=Armatimonas rosea TaxID=685828 RepID=A0A7W9SVQ6_ARMRO|nr:hypothetical protein [Armatimonas rosea]MBB6053571.1 hypothetical protein [Armatimonas rosea]